MAVKPAPTRGGSTGPTQRRGRPARQNGPDACTVRGHQRAPQAAATAAAAAWGRWSHPTPVLQSPAPPPARERWEVDVLNRRLAPCIPTNRGLLRKRQVRLCRLKMDFPSTRLSNSKPCPLPFPQVMMLTPVPPTLLSASTESRTRSFSGVKEHKPRCPTNLFKRPGLGGRGAEGKAVFLASPGRLRPPLLPGGPKKGEEKKRKERHRERRKERGVDRRRERQGRERGVKHALGEYPEPGGYQTSQSPDQM